MKMITLFYCALLISQPIDWVFLSFFFISKKKFFRALCAFIWGTSLRSLTIEWEAFVYKCSAEYLFESFFKMRRKTSSVGAFISYVTGLMCRNLPEKIQPKVPSYEFSQIFRAANFIILWASASVDYICFVLLFVTLFYIRKKYLAVNISCKVLLIRVLKIIEINLIFFFIGKF